MTKKPRTVKLCEAWRSL